MIAPYVVQADCTVRGGFVRHGTVVDLDIDSPLAAEYGGTANLQPLPAGQSGDDANHTELED